MALWTYWKENLHSSFSEWRVGNSFLGLLVALAVAFGYDYVARDQTIARWIALVAVLYIVGLLFVLTPQRMWARSQARVIALENHAKPQLRLAFEPDKPPYLQEVMDGADPYPYERRYRVGIVNDSSEVIRDVRVVLESFQQRFDGQLRPHEYTHPIFIEHALNIMGRDEKHGLVDVAPGDRPTAYADVMSQRLNTNKTEGDNMSPVYASGFFTEIFSRSEFVFTLRVEGGGTYSRARFRVGATLENRKIEMTYY